MGGDREGEVREGNQNGQEQCARCNSHFIIQMKISTNSVLLSKILHTIGM